MSRKSGRRDYTETEETTNSRVRYWNPFGRPDWGTDGYDATEEIVEFVNISRPEGWFYNKRDPFRQLNAETETVKNMTHDQLRRFKSGERIFLYESHYGDSKIYIQLNSDNTVSIIKERHNDPSLQRIFSAEPMNITSFEIGFYKVPEERKFKNFVRPQRLSKTEKRRARRETENVGNLLESMHITSFEEGTGRGRKRRNTKRKHVKESKRKSTKKRMKYNNKSRKH
uniref:Uncharacterized protein n=1 Tax=viral metagenome TaxID=1070528 RepID=A0A6C0KY91_9ZZZZ